MRSLLVLIATMTVPAPGCSAERSTTMDLVLLSRELQVSLPNGTRILGVDRESGIDDMVRAKLEVSREDFDELMASIPLMADKFIAGAGRLGSDGGFWNPRATPGIRYAQRRLPGGRALHVGYADAGQGRVVLFLINHGT
jgi:hypothetical protein